MIKFIIDYIKHFYLAIVILFASLAGYTYISGNNIVQKFESDYDYEVTAYGFNPSNEYWNPKTKTIVTPDGTLTLKHAEVTDGFVFIDEAGRSRNLMIIFEFTPSKDGVKPYSVLKDNFILYQGGRELSDGGVTNENDSQVYQDLMNSAVSFFEKGETTLGARAIAYQPNGGTVTIVINGKEFPLTDIINVYEQETADKLRKEQKLDDLKTKDVIEPESDDKSNESDKNNTEEPESESDSEPDEDAVRNNEQEIEVESDN